MAEASHGAFETFFPNETAAVVWGCSVGMVFEKTECPNLWLVSSSSSVWTLHVIFFASLFDIVTGVHSSIMISLVMRDHWLFWDFY